VRTTDNKNNSVKTTICDRPGWMGEGRERWADIKRGFRFVGWLKTTTLASYTRTLCLCGPIPVRNYAFISCCSCPSSSSSSLLLGVSAT